MFMIEEISILWIVVVPGQNARANGVDGDRLLREKFESGGCVDVDAMHSDVL